MENELPRYTGPADHLRDGFRSLETEFNSSHPVEIIQRTNPENSFNNKLTIARKIHGIGFAMRLATERSMHSRQHRLPGLQSSSIFHDTISGSDTSIGFEDFLNGNL